MMRRRLGFEALDVAYQPIVDAKTGRLFAHEVLCRPTHPRCPGPVELFELAVERAVVGELGRLVRSRAVSGCTDVPLFMNVHPLELDEGWLVRPDDPVFMHPLSVFVEITESVPMSKGSHTYGQLTELRNKGVAIVVDDLGAGYSNLRYIAELEPAVVKLDLSLVREMTNDRVFRLVRGITRTCADLGARVVAEGIETREVLAAVQAAGVDLAQGYFIARPQMTPPSPSAWAHLFPSSAIDAMVAEYAEREPTAPIPITRGQVTLGAQTLKRASNTSW